MQHILHIPPTKVLISEPLQKKKGKNPSHTKEHTFREMEIYANIIQENGPKAEKDKTERATEGRRTTEEINYIL